MKNNKEKINALLAKVKNKQKKLDKFTTTIKKENSNIEGSNDKRYARIEQLSTKRKIMFIDDKSVKSDEANEALKKNPVAKRNRPKVELIPMHCTTCNAVENVPPALAYNPESYKCVRCIKRAIRQ